MQTINDLIALGFDNSEAAALVDVIEYCAFPDADYNNNTLKFDISNDNCAKIIIIFNNVDIDGGFLPEYFSTTDKAYISKKDNRFSFECDTAYFNAEADDFVEYKLSFTFESIEIKTKSLKSRFEIFENKGPWFSLAHYASSIYQKVRLPYLTTNEKENEISDLLKEFDALDRNYIYENLSDISFNVIKSYLPKDNKSDKLFDEIRQCNDLSKQDKFIEKLYLHLSSKKYEQAWRTIFDTLNTSQENYDKTNINNLEKLAETHNYIDEVMQSNGYDGKYPSYKKHTKIKGLHLKKIMGGIYFAGMENATIFIECKDNINDECGYITFESSTILGKNNDVDRYSAFFAKKGKGFLSTEAIYYEIDEFGNISFEDDKYKIISSIICKKAEFKKLSKEENKIYKTPKTTAEIIFSLIVWLLCGVFFGIIMTLGFMLFELLATLFTGLISDFPQLFMDTPWWMIFLFASLAFSILMWIIDLIAD